MLYSALALWRLRSSEPPIVRKFLFWVLFTLALLFPCCDSWRSFSPVSCFAAPVVLQPFLESCYPFPILYPKPLTFFRNTILCILREQAGTAAASVSTEVVMNVVAGQDPFEFVMQGLDQPSSESEGFDVRVSALNSAGYGRPSAALNIKVRNQPHFLLF